MALLPGVLHAIGLYNSPERQKAEQDAQQALAAAQDQNELVKQIVLQNQQIAGGLGDQWFGQSPDAIAQALANQRAQYEQQHPGTTITGYGTNGQPVYGGAAAAPSAGDNTAKLTDLQNQMNGLGKQYQDIVTKSLNNTDPNGLPRDPALRAQMMQLKQKMTDLGNQAQVIMTGKNLDGSAPSAAVTDADRQEAQRQAEANYGSTLPGQLEASRNRRGQAVDAFTNAINGIKGVQAGDYDNKWNVDANKQYVSDAAKAAQKTAMDKTLALTDTKETAAEKLMREMARREQEQNLRSQSEAQANQLRSRGAYGSGAEIAGFLGNQQEQAQRRSLEEMQANANAQQRAMSALSAYGNQSFQLGQQDQASGALQDANSRFNSQSQQQWQQFKTKTQQQENDAAAKRAASTLDAKNAQENVARGDIAQVADRQAQIAGLKTGANTTGAELSGQATGMISGAYNTDAANHAAKANNDESITSGIL